MKALSALLSTAALAAISAAQTFLTPAWSDRYNGPANGYDDAGAICTDAAGSAYVAGMAPANGGLSSFVVIKYSAAGVRQWVARHTGAGGMALQVAADAQFNVYASGYRWASPSYEEFIAKFDSAGRELWSRRLDGRPAKLLVDSSGSVYVIGHFGDGYDSDWSIQKLSPLGKKLWEARYDHPSGRDDLIANAMFDGAGNLVVVGTVGTDINGTPGDILLAKYAPSGALLWRQFYAVGPTTHEFADDLGLDGAGNIYVIGGTARNGSIYEQASDLWLKYASNGALIGQVVGGIAPNGDVGGGVVDSAGNLYHVTFSRVSRFSPTGALVWRREIESPQLGITIPKIVLTSLGEIVVGGTSHDGTFRGDYLVFGFTPSGSLNWQHRFNGAEDGDDTLEGLAASPRGDVLVTGTSWNQYASIGGTADDIVTLSFRRSRK